MACDFDSCHEKVRSKVVRAVNSFMIGIKDNEANLSSYVEVSVNYESS